jgi:hypothetical protein
MHEIQKNYSDARPHQMAEHCHSSVPVVFDKLTHSEHKQSRFFSLFFLGNVESGAAVLAPLVVGKRNKTKVKIRQVTNSVEFKSSDCDM